MKILKIMKITLECRKIFIWQKRVFSHMTVMALHKFDMMIYHHAP